MKSKPATPPSRSDPQRVHDYARAVVAGQVVAGRFVVAACQRHLADLETGKTRGLVWRPEKAEAVLDFFEETLWLEQGKPFRLQPFQAFIVGSVFGWYRQDHDNGELRRRFRTLYAEMGKGNGKTPLAAGIGLYGLTLDREAAPEIYAAAVAKEQARICFKDATRMVRASPELAKRVEILTHNLSVPARNASFTVLSSEDKGHHGLRVHIGLLDEIHAHASSAVVDTIEAGTKNCRNSLIVLITNSGATRQGPCWAYHDRAVAMLQGKPDDSLFAYVCTLDPCPKCLARGHTQIDLKCRTCDDWRDLDLLAKANPGLGTVLDRDYVRSRIQLAQRMPSKRSNVLQLNVCYWTQSSNGWLDLAAWRDKCLRPALRLAQFKGRRCWIGMDAANRVDATTVAFLFENEEGGARLDPAQLGDVPRQAFREAAGQADAGPRDADEAATEASPSVPLEVSASGYSLFLRTYVPRAMVDNQSQANHEAYARWEAEGHLVVTPGAVTDFKRIEQDLLEFAREHTIARLQADPRELGYLLQVLAAELGPEVVVQVQQGPAMISQPMKMFEGLVAAGLIHHDGNPVLDWMLGNVEQQVTKSGRATKFYYPVKSSADKKIDAAPSAFMALDGALRAPGEVVGEAFVVGLG